MLREVFPAVRADVVAEHVRRAGGDANLAAETLYSESEKAIRALEAAEKAPPGCSAPSDESAFVPRLRPDTERERPPAEAAGAVGEAVRTGRLAGRLGTESRAGRAGCGRTAEWPSTPRRWAGCRKTRRRR